MPQNFRMVSCQFAGPHGNVTRDGLPVGGRFVVVEAGEAAGMVPYPITALFDDEQLPFIVELVISTQSERDPTLVVEVLRCERRPQGRAVTAALMRSIPVAALARQAIRSAAVTPDFAAWAEPEIASQSMRALRRTPGNALAEEDLDETVRLYREAMAAPGRKAPIEHIFERHSAAPTKATAKRWVGEARKRGLMGPSTGTRAGESS